MLNTHQTSYTKEELNQIHSHPLPDGFAPIQATIGQLRAEREAVTAQITQLSTLIELAHIDWPLGAFNVRFLATHNNITHTEASFCIYMAHKARLIEPYGNFFLVLTPKEVTQ